jgi:hypothetical protein
MFNVWIARRSEDNQYKVAGEVAEIVLEELNEPFDDKTCTFCSNKIQEGRAVIVWQAADGVYTTSTCEECADSMSDAQLAEKIQQDVEAAKKRHAEMLAAREQLIERGVLVDSGEKRPSPKTGELQIAWKINPELTEERQKALTAMSEKEWAAEKIRLRRETRMKKANIIVVR